MSPPGNIAAGLAGFRADLPSGKNLAAPVSASGGRWVTRRISRAHAGFEAADLDVVIRHEEVSDRHAVDAAADFLGRVDHAMNGGNPLVVGPTHQKIAMLMMKPSSITGTSVQSPPRRRTSSPPGAFSPLRMVNAP